MKYVIKPILFITFLFGGLISFSQRDTFATYQMGEIKIVEGLSYGNIHTIVLFTDSTFEYSTTTANQISISSGILAAGFWSQKNNLISLIDSTNLPGEFVYASSMRDPESTNLKFIFNFGRYFSVFNFPDLTIYCKDSVYTTKLNFIESAQSEPVSHFKKYVPEFKAELELECYGLDSLRICDVVFVSDAPRCNKFGFYLKPPFNLTLVQKKGRLQVIENYDAADYFFEKVD